MRDLETFELEGNTMWRWREAKGLLSVTKNVLLMESAKIMPLRVKNALYRVMGVRLGERVSIGLDATLDVFFPELIEIGDDSVIGADVMILTHEFLQDRWRRGPVKVGEGVMVGANSTILAGVTVGDGASVKAATLVDRDVPEGAIAYGNPMQIEER